MTKHTLFIKFKSRDFMQLLVFAEQHAEQLPDELKALVPVFSRIFPHISAPLARDLKKDAKRIFDHYLRLMCNRITYNWHTFIRAQLGKGGGLLFKYISKWDKQFLNVDWAKSERFNSPEKNITSGNPMEIYLVPPSPKWRNGKSSHPIICPAKVSTRRRRAL